MKQIEVFEQDYERFLMIAGKPEKIAFAVRNLMQIFLDTTTAITKLYDDIYVVREEINTDEPKKTASTAAGT